MSTQHVSKHKVVSFTYSLVDDQGEIFEQSDIPLDYIHGIDNNMFPKVELALNGRLPGDQIEIILSPGEGFGHVQPELLFTDDLENAPQEYRFVGAKPTFKNEAGEMVELTVTQIDNGKITIDANHPLAGKTVKFIINIIAIRDASGAELGRGSADRPHEGYLH